MIDLSQLDVSSPVSYLVAVFVPALDAILPVLPSETAVIALGVATAGSEDLRIGILVVLAALGAFIGDNVNYLIGRYFGPAVERRFFSSERGAARLAWPGGPWTVRCPDHHRLPVHPRWAHGGDPDLRPGQVPSGGAT